MGKDERFIDIGLHKIGPGNFLNTNPKSNETQSSRMIPARRKRIGGYTKINKRARFLL